MGVLLGMLLSVTAMQATRQQQDAACQTVYDRNGKLDANDLREEIQAQGLTVSIMKASKAVNRFHAGQAQGRTQMHNQHQQRKARGQQRAAANQDLWEANAPELNRQTRIIKEYRRNGNYDRITFKKY